MKFNVIYTPNTIQYATLFAHSLQKWSDCSFRLVANGCSPAEARLLQAFCARSSRFEFFALPTKTMMAHGQALTFLQSRTSSDTFCFMDSDILATGEFLNSLLPHLGQYAGVFSCSPVWLEEEEKVLPSDFSRMAGRYHKTSDNTCIGSSYFAIYDNRALTRIMRSTGIDFNKYEWRDIPARYQKQLAQRGFEKKLYDTGKLLNLLLLGLGERLLFKETPALQHIGGISTITNDYSSLASQVKVFFIQRPIFRRLLAFRARRRINPRLSSAEALAMQKKRAKKIKTCRYVGRLLHALFQEQPLPAIPNFENPQVGERIELLTAHIVALYEEHRGQL